ncbi:receptor activity-modifying protein 1 isoform X1 [Ictalurus punctatus]|uniref:Receptor activity-modifying protein 1 isoform X1 n=2 Tax=Ictalurus punctatus TaxID=7998 RepID=A0A2D0QSA7_ICTPU|nr:receptor activity-modifying protein 1 isoform X1 [Ictalurus punctatus]
MPPMLSGLLSLLLDLTLISGQIAEGTMNTSEDVVKNFTTQFHNVSLISDVSGTLITENTKDNATHEDQVAFQDQDIIHHYRNCDETLFIMYGKLYCIVDFDNHMINLRQEDWCDWEMVLGNYNNLTTCMEIVAKVAHCYYPNTIVQEMFVEIHNQYFSSCVTKEDTFPDAPPRVVLVLTLLPVSVIPILVYMVIWKSSVID